MNVKEIQRFQTKIQLDILSGCWNWIGAFYYNGYGAFYYNKKSGSAHRFSYEYWNGIIPKDKQIDHICRNKKCVNPYHLEVVTQKENIQRGLAGHHDNRPNSRKTNYPQGHPYSTENTYIDSKNTRHCKICTKLRNNKIYVKVNR